MELRTLSTEIIKPSSPTPADKKTYNLSLIDQLNLDIYFGYHLFYKRIDKNIIEISDHLKKSLSETLTHYYPFAGRVKNNSFIDCDDSGVPFIEAQVAINMSEVLRKPESNIREQLMPYNPNCAKVSTDQVNLAVQLNYFDCGGIAICVCFRHVIADAIAAVNFLKNWAAVACGDCDIKQVIFNCSSIFPPNELATNILRNTTKKQRSINCIPKRFMFEGTKIDALKENIKNRSGFSPTRFEVVSAIIWGALISMARETGDASPLIVIPVNVRKIMNPPLPQECIGNVIHSVTGNCLDNKATDYVGLVKKIRELVKMVNDDDVRTYYNGEGLANQLREGTEQFVNDTPEVNIFCVTSLCGAPTYEVDFGWGQPTWSNSLLNLHNVVILSDTSDGKGVEAWVGFSEKTRAKFEQDPGILTYASFNPILISPSKL